MRYVPLALNGAAANIPAHAVALGLYSAVSLFSQVQQVVVITPVSLLLKPIIVLELEHVLLRSGPPEVTALNVWY